ncbi:hypothetical protein M407DRAFT_131259 [Tulasnella calospora MUT 4182]|uniref:Uncharacterized protein n=1 Tax=Tulasnella calospora MUT 4182 TaxID=1051891 RepID=A0A0C3LC87_9AGAM|nr:hypothetical protein M407DRAFT_131259 [Tulasnella calospora MUT 4182]
MVSLFWLDRYQKRHPVHRGIASPLDLSAKQLMQRLDVPLRYPLLPPTSLPVLFLACMPMPLIS